MPFYVLAWIANVFFSIEVIIAKLTAKYTISNPWLFNFVWTLCFVIVIVPVAVLNNASIPINWNYIVIASIFNTITNIFYILALYKLDVSVISPMYNLRTALAVIVSAIFLNEILEPNQYFLIGIMFIAGLFTSLDEKFSLKSFFTMPVALVLSAITTLVFMSIFLNKAIAKEGYWNVVLWSTILTQIFLVATVPLFYKEIRKITYKQIEALAAMALVGVVGTLVSFKAYASNVGITSAILSIPLSMIFAFFISIFAPKLLEKHTLKVYAIRFTAAGIMILIALKLTT